MEGIEVGKSVLFIPHNEYYIVEAVEEDVVYLIDSDGSSFIATEDEIKF